MKKFLPVLLLSAVLASCNNVEQFRGQIESLATNWETATTAVTGFKSLLDGEMGSLNQLMGAMSLGQDVMSKLKDDGKAKLTEFQSQAQAQKDGLSGMAGEVESFITGWTEKAGMLSALQQGLTDKKLPKDVAAQITSLTEAVTGASTTVEGWQGKLTGAKSAISTLSQGFTEWLATVNPAPAAKK